MWGQSSVEALDVGTKQHGGSRCGDKAAWRLLMWGQSSVEAVDVGTKHRVGC